MPTCPLAQLSQLLSHCSTWIPSWLPSPLLSPSISQDSVSMMPPTLTQIPHTSSTLILTASFPLLDSKPSPWSAAPPTTNSGFSEPDRPSSEQVPHKNQCNSLIESFLLFQVRLSLREHKLNFYKKVKHSLYLYLSLDIILSFSNIYLIKSYLYITYIPILLNH